MLALQGHVASACPDGTAALRVVLRDQPDLIVLDLSLPGMDGLTLLARLRAERCPARVLILTARSEVEHRIAGLQAGADDYLTKPFAMDELAARVAAVGRRAAASTAADRLQVADLHLDVHQRRVTRAGVPIELSPRELDLLLVLMQEPGRVFSRGELCDRVWQRDYEYDTRTVDIFIGRLRRKVDGDGAVPLFHTVRSIGYTLRAPA